MYSKKQQVSLGQRSVMSLSLTAALAAMITEPTIALAACIPLNSNSTVTGSTGCVAWGGGNLTLTSNGTLTSSGTPALTVNTPGGTLINNGHLTGDLTISSGSGTVYGGMLVVGSGTINRLDTSGTISTTGSISSSTGNKIGALLNQGTIGTLTNSGTIKIDGTINTNYNTVQPINVMGAIVNAGGTISSLINNGTISATGTITEPGINRLDALFNSGNIGTLQNNSNATISSDRFAIENTGTINSLNNFGTISGNIAAYSSDPGAGLNALINSGLLTGGVTGISNGGSIGSLTNHGTISGDSIAIGNFGTGTISILTNTGTISNGNYGINNTGTINIINNSRLISGALDGIFSNGGNIGTLTNTGTVTGSSHAINIGNSGNFGPIINSGLIAGNITNASSNDLIIHGGGGTLSGTLTGASSGLGTADIGTITNTSSNLVFASGNQLLNNNINVTGHAVNNSGSTLQVNNSIAITGNYTQGVAGTLSIGVADGAVASGVIGTDSGYGRLVVSGSVTMTPGSSVALQKLNTYAFAAGQRFVVVTASGVANYNENALNYAASGYTGSLSGSTVTSGGTNNLVVTLAANPATPAPSSPATVPNAVAALGGLSRYTGIDPALLNLFNAGQALNLGSTADANRAGRQLNPISSTVSSQAVTAPTLDTLNIVAAHTDSLRLAQSDRASGLSAGNAASATGVWGQAFAGQARQDERDQVSAYRANYSGLLFGVDQQLDERWNIGGVFSYSNARIRDTGSNAGNSSDVDAYGLLAYGSYSGQPWYLNFSAGAIQQRYATTRTISFPGFAGVANGKFDGMQYVAKAEVGYPLVTGNVTTTPLLGLTYSRLNQDAYTESGGNGAALAVGSTSVNSLQSDLGVKFERELATSYGSLIPSLKLAWRHEFDNNRAATNARFVADPSGETSFTSLGASPVKNSAMISLGATLLREKNLSLSVRYDLQRGSGFLSQSGSLRLRKLF
jgi:outer membrane autotransporter protein